MLQYIYHSCFVWEAESFLLVYDYWKDPEGRLRALLDGAGERAVYFVVSHFHEDHFNPDVAEWCAAHDRWHLLPSYDTAKRRRIAPELPLAVLRFGEQVSTPHFRLRAYRSTDVGVCTVAELADGRWRSCTSPSCATSARTTPGWTTPCSPSTRGWGRRCCAARCS